MKYNNNKSDQLDLSNWKVGLEIQVGSNISCVENICYKRTHAIEGGSSYPTPDRGGGDVCLTEVEQMLMSDPLSSLSNPAAGPDLRRTRGDPLTYTKNSIKQPVR